VVILATVGGNRKGSFGSGITHERVVDTLNEEGIKLRNHLTTDPKTELGRGSGVIRMETGTVLLNTGDVGGFNPNITQEVTLGPDRNRNLVIGTERTNVIHTLGLHGEVGVSFIVLAEETDLGITRDVDILGTHRHELN